MHRIDNTCFLLYIEPPQEARSQIPVEDEIARIITIALSEAVHGTANYFELNEPPSFDESSGWRGYHRTGCGVRSTSCDYFLQNGMITNSLCVFYLQYYRDSIPSSEMEKVRSLVSFYKEKYRRSPEFLLQEVPYDPHVGTEPGIKTLFPEKRVSAWMHPQVEEPKDETATNHIRQERSKTDKGSMG
jgi:hypothetical protein